MEFSRAVYNFIEEKELLAKGDGVVVGLSGGADSTALLLLLAEIREKYQLSLLAVHVNHGIRGEEAARDAEFSRNLAKKYSVPFSLYNIDVPKLSKESGMTEEEVGRRERYRIFEEVRSANHFQKIAVAHHRDDQVETVLFNLIRGAGLKGLAGMKPKRGCVIRPLLAVGRADIEEYLAEKQQEYCMDRTNLLMEYDRNRIRNVILPELKKINEGADRHILYTAAAADEAMDAVCCEADAVERFCLEENETVIRISIKKLENLRELVFGEVMLRMMERISGKRKDLTRNHIEDLRKLISKKSGSSIDLPYGMRAFREYDMLIIEKTALDAKRTLEKTLSEEVIVQKEELERTGKASVYFESYRIDFRLLRAGSEGTEVSKSDDRKTFDYGMIKKDICIRHPKEGDRIQINKKNADGTMALGYKSISRLMIDQKLPKTMRASVVLFMDGEDCLWMYGSRIGENYKISIDTQQVLVASIERIEEQDGLN